ncbi:MULTISPECIES: DUF3830 family protein [Salinibaculum]|uniref:DUF3830 family protein n=1 Tax=Salinibaculum TaxID=2732368 RepID=UPI0030D588EC
MLEITTNEMTFTAEIHDQRAPETAAGVRELLPLESTLMHVRWSGIATWINIDDLTLPDIPRENHTVYPSCGDILLYPGYRNEQEILLPCGPTCFKSPAGELAGNHFATISDERDRLRSLEQTTLEDGEQTVRIEEIQ